jgi:ABC-2 type transport system permease protein
MSPRHAFAAEWTKLRTSPGTAWLVVAVIAGTVGVGTMAAAAIACPSGTCPVDPAKVSLTGVQLGQAVVAILAVLAVGGEYSTGMIRVTLTATPRRTMVLAAKAAVLAVVVAVAAIVAVAGSLVAGRLLLPVIHGFPPVSPGEAPVLRAAVGSVVYLILVGLLSAGTATAARDPATAIGIVLGLLYLFPIVAQVVPDPDWQRHLQQIGPMTAGLSIQATAQLDTLPIGPWAGLGVLAAWAAGLLLIGGLLLRLRDA